MADPRVIQGIRSAARQAGADPAALLATSLTESGARPGIVGDQGTSFGAFQFHRGGALGTHAPAWADTPAAYLNRAQEFARLGVHGGKGAAAVQRPADPAGYAAKVDANLARARQILGQHAAIAATQPQQPITTTPLASGVIPGNSLLQSLIDANAKNAGIAPIQLPTMPTLPTTLAPRAPAPSAVNPTQPLSSSGNRGIYQKTNWAGADQGVDYRGAGHVTALADAVITRVDAKSSWIGAGGKGTGAIVSYRITRGPYKGRNVYVAENITPRVRVGQQVRAGQPIAMAHGSFPYTESGWADQRGSPIGALGTSSTGRDFAKSWSLA